MAGEEQRTWTDGFVDVIKLIIESEKFTTTGVVNMITLLCMVIGGFYELFISKSVIIFFVTLGLAFILTIFSVQQATEVWLNHKIHSLK